MKTCLSLACGAVALAASSAFAADLSAAQVADKNVAARGGLAAWRAVQSISMAGEMDAGGKQDTKLPFVMKMKRPHNSRLEITFQDKTAVQAYNGTQGWKYRPYLNRDDIEPFTPAETKSAAAAAELDGPLIDYASKGTKLELAGVDNVEGKKAYKLKLTPKNGSPLNLWVDATSFLEVKIDGEPRRLDGRIRKVAVFYRDYKKVGTVTVPYTLETVVEGVRETHKMNFKTVTLNPKLDNAIFARPQLAALKSMQPAQAQ